jgi:Tol biopolymer transport system component
MSPDRRLEQDLPRLLDDLYVGPMPGYRDDVLRQTARSRQRPAWSFPGRWLPVVDIARQPVPAPRLQWSAIALALLLLALLVTLVAALVVGGHQRLPKPFGPARTGLVALARGGDIYTVDAATGDATAIVRGPETDLDPRWSRDGTRLAFERKASGDEGPGLVYVARADGSDPIRVTPEPLPGITGYDFSPDGTELLISADIGGIPGMLVAATDGGRIRQLAAGMPATEAAWRPPDGSEILFMDTGDRWNGRGSILAVSVESGKVRTILERADGAGRYRGHLSWSPDGSLISYGEWTDGNDFTVQTHIIAADGSGDRVLPLPPGAVWQAPESWSNDGTRLLAIRGYTGGLEQTRPVAIPVDGKDPGIEIQYPVAIGVAGISAWEWAPDDSLVLGTPPNASGTALLGQVLLDPVTGTSRTLSWASLSRPSWQRLGG